MNITFYRKNVYGKELRYIANPTIADAIIRLTGKLTIDENDMTELRVLGCTFEEVVAPYIA